MKLLTSKYFVTKSFKDTQVYKNSLLAIQYSENIKSFFLAIANIFYYNSKNLIVVINNYLKIVYCK